jgi:hypothetical protein
MVSDSQLLDKLLHSLGPCTSSKPALNSRISDDIKRHFKISRKSIKTFPSICIYRTWLQIYLTKNVNCKVVKVSRCEWAPNPPTVGLKLRIKLFPSIHRLLPQFLCVLLFNDITIKKILLNGY